MQCYVAFLRGINVGGRVVKMVDLMACLEAAGFNDVVTYLQSGNVAFTSDSPDVSQVRSTMEAAVSEQFGYTAIIFVYPQEELARMIDACPFPNSDDQHHTYVVLVPQGAESEFDAALKMADSAIEQVKPGENCLYWRVERGKTLETSFAKQLNTSKLKPLNTVRNLNTLQKMVTTPK
jgi:uncharacterized protein (DUF1697 family)